MAWKILAEPQGDNTSYDAGTAENKGGIVIYLVETNNYIKQEVGRVAFERKNSTNPRVKFETQLDKEIAKAQKAIKVINDLTDGAGELH